MEWRAWSRRLLPFGLMTVLVGCEGQDAERLGRLGRKVSAKLDGVTTETQEVLGDGLRTMRTNYTDATLDTRVAIRLRWEKSLAEASIQVSANEGVVELKGTVANPEQRQRAVDVAGATTGVVQVKDELTVGEGP